MNDLRTPIQDSEMFRSFTPDGGSDDGVEGGIAQTEHVTKMSFILNSGDEISETDDEVPENLNMILSTHGIRKNPAHLSCTESDVAAALKACERDRLRQGPEPDRKHMDQSRTKTGQIF